MFYSLNFRTYSFFYLIQLDAILIIFHFSPSYNTLYIIYTLEFIFHLYYITHPPFPPPLGKFYTLIARLRLCQFNCANFTGWFQTILPKSALTVEEEAWNAYPYTKTLYRCPFVQKFSLEIETRYFNDSGEQENVFKLSGNDLRNRVVG